MEMDTLRLLPLRPDREEDIAAYRAEFLPGRPCVTDDPRRIPGLDHLEDFPTVSALLEWGGTMAGKVSWFLCVREKDGMPVGCLCLRHRLEYDDDDPEFCSHIGYSVRPSQRGKGYGREQLRLGLREAEALGLRRVRVLCVADNTASRRVILANGGVYRDTLHGEISGLDVLRYDIFPGR